MPLSQTQLTLPCVEEAPHTYLTPDMLLDTLEEMRLTVKQSNRLAQITRRHVRVLARRRAPMKDQTRVVNYLSASFGDSLNEKFIVMFLRQDISLLTTKVIAEGTINACAVPIRRIVQLALDSNAANVIIAHNHVSHDVEPSSADIEVTKKIVAALDLIDVKVLDHIVFSASDYHSFKDHKDLNF